MPPMTTMMMKFMSRSLWLLWTIVVATTQAPLSFTQAWVLSSTVTSGTSRRSVRAQAWRTRSMMVTTTAATVTATTATTSTTDPAISTSTTTSTSPSFDSSSNTSTLSTSGPILIRGKAVEHSHCQSLEDRDILVRAARGEQTERTPVWLMRQAGRYMQAFRQYSDVLAFRERSETPDVAVELSLQCHRAYGMDGIILFSDILTPLPCLGIDFDVIKGHGPILTTKIRTESDVRNLPRFPFDEKVKCVRELLQRLSVEAEKANTSLIGFVGAPFTLAAYTIEGKASKHCLETKKLLLADTIGDNPALSLFLDRLSDLIGDYAIYQIESGAQVIQIFESWAHQLSPLDFELYAKPAAMKVIHRIRQAHPETPIIYYANGGSSYLEKQKDMGVMIGVDWAVDLATARQILGPDVPISGNIDPRILFGSKEQIEQAVRGCIDAAGGPGNAHILNLGHGVMQGTPEAAVQWLVDECKRLHRPEPLTTQELN